MKLNNKLYPLICFLMGIIVQIGMYNITKAENAENIVELSYLPLGNISSGRTLTVTAKLRAKNNSPDPIYNVKATVYSLRNIFIDIREVSLGDIRPGENKTGSESFRISFDVFLPQEPLQKEIAWLVEYVNKTGKNIFEVIPLH